MDSNEELSQIDFQRVREFLRNYQASIPGTARVLDLTSEIAELAAELQTQDPERNSELEEEFGDVCYALIAFVVESGGESIQFKSTCANQSPHNGLNQCLGKLAKEMLRATEYGQAPDAAIPRTTCEELVSEMVGHLQSLASSRDVNLSRALRTVIEKYRRRIEDSGSQDSGN